MKTSLICTLFLAAIAFYSCKTSPSYNVTRLSAKANCGCDEIKKSIKFFKKSYKSEKSIEVYEAILMPIDRINNEDYVYTEFKVIKDCLDMEFDKSEDEYYYIITENQWEMIKDYRCN